jgi:hypothetical protein
MRHDEPMGIPTPTQVVLLAELGFLRPPAQGSMVSEEIGELVSLGPQGAMQGDEWRDEAELEGEEEGDSELTRAVRRFQRAKGLIETGLIDAATASALAREDRRLHPRGDFPTPREDERPA